MRGTQLLIVLVALGLVVGAVPGGALAGATTETDISSSESASIDGSTITAQTDDVNASGDDNTSRATVGQQLATVIAVTDDEVGSDVEASSLDAALEDANESERASILADRAATLRDRTDEVVTDQREARAAYEDGNITRGEFAQRLAVLSGQASTLDRNFERLNESAAGVSTLELRTAGYDRSANEEARARLDRATGSGAIALLAQYTGERSGEFSLEVDDSVSIEVESDDGGSSREIERDQPGNGTFVVTQSEALTAATESLSTDRDGEWTLRAVDRDTDDGYYEFEFAFFGPETTGEAEVSVDGQTGEVFEFEEELEPRDADDDAEAPLSVSIVNGTTDPGATVTLRVTAAGQPVKGATVEFDDQSVGQTDADGRVNVTLPDDDEVDIEVDDGEREGELEITLRADDERDEDEEFREQLAASGSIDNGTVTVSVTHDGEGISGATVYADEERVGTTDANGAVSFVAPETDEELEVTVVKGALGVELEFEVGSDGTLSLEDANVDERDEDDGEADERDEDDGEADERDEDDGEANDEDEDDGEANDEDEELSVTVISGEAAPGATVTLEVTDSDGPVPGAEVEVEGGVGGTTDADGQITVTLPDGDEAEIDVEDGEREGELELEFEDEAEESDEETEEEEAEEDEAEDDEEAEEDEAEDDEEAEEDEAEDDEEAEEDEAEDDEETEEDEAEDDEETEEDDE